MSDPAPDQFDTQALPVKQKKKSILLQVVKNILMGFGGLFILLIAFGIAVYPAVRSQGGHGSPVPPQPIGTSLSPEATQKQNNSIRRSIVENAIKEQVENRAEREPVFLDYMHRSIPLSDNSSDEQLLNFGNLVCNTFDQGATAEHLDSKIIELSNGDRSHTALLSEMSGVSAGVLCPEHAHKFTKFHNAFPPPLNP